MALVFEFEGFKDFTVLGFVRSSDFRVLQVIIIVVPITILVMDQNVIVLGFLVVLFRGL